MSLPNDPQAAIHALTAEIEAVLLGLPGVRDCAVFGIPDPEFGEQVCAHVEALPGVQLDADALRAGLAERLARFKVPRTIVFADQLPREDSGKIFKRKLKAPYWEAVPRTAG